MDNDVEMVVVFYVVQTDVAWCVRCESEVEGWCEGVCGHSLDVFWCEDGVEEVRDIVERWVADLVGIREDIDLEMSLENIADKMDWTYLVCF